MLNQLEEFDLRKLREARKLIAEVYDYYYGFNPARREEARLETILNKLDYLIGDESA